VVVEASSEVNIVQQMWESTIYNIFSILRISMACNFITCEKTRHRDGHHRYLFNGITLILAY